VEEEEVVEVEGKGKCPARGRRNELPPTNRIMNWRRWPKTISGGALSILGIPNGLVSRPCHSDSTRARAPLPRFSGMFSQTEEEEEGESFADGADQVRSTAEVRVGKEARVVVGLNGVILVWRARRGNAPKECFPSPAPKATSIAERARVSPENAPKIDSQGSRFGVRWSARSS